MADFEGTVVPAAYARLAKFYDENPEYMKFDQSDNFYSILSHAADLLNDGVRDYDSDYVDIPITGITGEIDVSEYDMVSGGTQSGIITPEIIPSNTDESYSLSYSSSDEDVVTIDDGVITAVGVGSAIITLSVIGKTFEKTFTVTVVDTTE